MFDLFRGNFLYSAIANLYKTHKVIFVGLIIVLAITSYYLYGYLFSDQSANRYVLSKAEKGTLIVSVSGSGQVSNTSLSDIKSKVSGDISALLVKNGQSVKSGALIAQIDAREALKSVRDAENNLASAKLALEKLNKPNDKLTILQAENAIISANDAKKKSEDEKLKAYEDGYSAVADAFTELPNIMSGLQKVLFNYDLSKGQDNLSWYADQTDANSTDRDRALKYKTDVYNSYQSARSSYLASLDAFKNSSRNDNQEKIEKIITDTYEALKIISDSIKITNNYIDFIQDTMIQRSISVPSAMNSHQNDLDSFTNNSNTSLNSLLSVKNTIINSNDAIKSAERTILEKTESLKDIQLGADPLDIKSQELVVKQRESALLDARSELANYYIRAPFDGIVAKTNVRKGENVSSGTVIANFISNDKIAEITLNEVDVAKIKNDQKATLTFDAIPDLTVAGRVVEIDVSGVISQGVVSYTVRIIMDTQDERIKPSMSVSASIITEVKQDVIVIPSSAIKGQNGDSYVEVPLNAEEAKVVTDQGSRSGIDLPSGLDKKYIQVGISNDTSSEVISGLDSGQDIITNTIKATSTSSTTSSQSQLRIPGLTGGNNRPR